VFELRGPSNEQLHILGFLHGNDGVTKKALIEHAEEKALPFIVNTEAESDEGRYRALDSHIINPLTENEYITVEKAGREKRVSITQRGIDALAAFPLGSETMEAVEHRGDTDVREMRSQAFNPDLESMTSQDDYSLMNEDQD
jgi:hypothetical protein